MRIEISVDDGHYYDMKTAILLEKYGFKGIFFIPTQMSSLPMDRIHYLDANHEVGAHTVTHPMDLKLLADAQLDYEIGFCKQELQDLLGHPVTKFCYPRGRFNERVKENVAHHGYQYARTTVVGNTDLPKDMFAVNTSVHVFPNRTEYEGIGMMPYFDQQLDMAWRKGKKGYFHLWMHSSELHHYDLWNQLEIMLARMKEKNESLPPRPSKAGNRRGK